jgi:ubiquinone/menaquinone biosynthesis C-methylase UbiE
MTTTHAAEGIRDRQLKHWNAVADGWGAWFEWTERNFAPLTAWLHDAAQWSPGKRVLDVACGAGYPGIAAARVVQPGGRVIAADLSPQMLAVAAARAQQAGVEVIEFAQFDAESVPYPDRSFDAVTNTYGLMFCPDPQSAVHEAHRVLDHGGRIALVTWDDPAKSPFFTLARSAAVRHLGLAEPSPQEPHAFRLASPDALVRLLQAAGFSGIRVESLPMTFESLSSREYCRMFGDLAWKSKVNTLSEQERTAFEDAVADAAQPYMVGGRLRLAASSLCASATR